MTAYVGERQVDSVRCGIHGDGVRPGRPVPAELDERAIPLFEDGHDARLRRHIQPSPRRIGREDVGIAPDRDYLAQLKRPEVQDAERRTLFAGDECETVWRVDVDPVRMPDRPIERDASHDLGGRGIDHCELIRGLDRDEDAV